MFSTLASILFAPAFFEQLMFPAFPFVQVQNDGRPHIQTFDTATSSGVVILSPSGYQSSVVSIYDNGQFHTVATSTPMTVEDLRQMRDDMERQQQGIQKMFNDQEAFFQQQD